MFAKKVSSMDKSRNEQQEAGVLLERCLVIVQVLQLTQLMTGKVSPDAMINSFEELLCEACSVFISLASSCHGKDAADPILSITFPPSHYHCGIVPHCSHLSSDCLWAY